MCDVCQALRAAPDRAFPHLLLQNMALPHTPSSSPPDLLPASPTFLDSGSVVELSQHLPPQPGEAFLQALGYVIPKSHALSQCCFWGFKVGRERNRLLVG